MLLIWLVCIIASCVSALWMLVAILGGSKRAWRIAIAFDQLANAATGGSEDETISSRAYRGSVEKRRVWCVLCRLLDLIEKDHCKKSQGV
ncbi:hypothetical protein GTP58_28485 [Duganella sp. CY15W]|nr:hypothetical protein [Duganella sp. CY15W]